MGTLNEKLDYLKQTKQEIREAIINKGQQVSASDTFRSYASKISAITSSGKWYNWRTSSTVTSWRDSTQLPNGIWYDMTYGDGKFVAISTGNGSYCGHSIDGMNWLSYTLPNTQEWRNIAYGDGKFVITSFSDTGAYSLDGINWTETSMPNCLNGWSTTVYGDNKFVSLAMGENKIAYSSDGINWSLALTPDDKEYGYSNVTYGDGKFVAIVNNPTPAMAYSSDGINWSIVSLPEGAELYLENITYGDGKFVAISWGSDVIMSSTDGINWSIGYLPKEGQWEEIAYGDGKFVIVAYESNETLYSTDLENWTSLPITSEAWGNVVYGNGRFVVKTWGSTLSSCLMCYEECFTTDGTPTTSTEVYDIPKKSSVLTISSVGQNYLILSNGKTYNRTIAGDVNNPVLNVRGITTNNIYNASSEYLDGYSEVSVNIKANTQNLYITPSKNYQDFSPSSGFDGYDHVGVYPVTSNIDSNIREENIIEGVDILGVTGTAEVPIIPIMGNQLVMMGYKSDVVTYSRDNGENWAFDGSGLTSASWSSITYGNGKYVAISGTPTSFSACSSDGINWEIGNLPSNGNWSKVVYGSGVYVALNWGFSRGAYSSDGINWYKHETNMGSRDIAYGNEIFISVDKSSYYYSEDGINWTEYSLPSKGTYWHVAYGNGRFVLVKDDSTEALYSFDGINWTETSLSDSLTWQNVIYGGGVFIAITKGDWNNGYYSNVSYDGINWEPSVNVVPWLGESSSDTSAELIAMCYDGTKFIGILKNGNYMIVGDYRVEPPFWTYYPSSQEVSGGDWRCICGVSGPIGKTTVDAMLNEINGEVITNYVALNDALDSINGESA